jgi:hypothetical protein
LIDLYSARSIATGSIRTARINAGSAANDAANKIVTAGIATIAQSFATPATDP